jgi:acetoacetyl-CoA synthetase
VNTERIEPIWRPSDQRIAATHMRRFIERVRPRLADDGYAALHRWSVEQPEAFWPALADFAGVRFSSPAEEVLVGRDRMPGARWFEGATLSFADNLLRPEHLAPALVVTDETGRRTSIDRGELRERAAALAAALEAYGVESGDRVAALLPNCAETVVAMLAAASIGATFSTCSPDFGAAGVLERFGQIEPKVLIAADGYHYAG